MKNKQTKNKIKCQLNIPIINCITYQVDNVDFSNFV